MKNADDTSTIDAIATALAQRLAGRTPPNVSGPIGPLGQPDPELPPLLPPGAQWDNQIPGLQIGSRVSISGVEYTQSTQYNSLTTSWYANDNSIPVVAYKTLVARVYPTVRLGQFGGDTLSGQRVTGELTISVGNRVTYQTGPTRDTGARLGAAGKIDRSLWDREMTAFTTGLGGLATTRAIEINCPLNFIVPAYYCRLGRLYVTVRVWPIADGAGSSRSATWTESIQTLDVPAPKVCLVRVNWTDSAGTTYSPTDAQMLGTLSLAERMLPFPYFEATILTSEISSTAAFATAAQNGGCNTAWSNLVTDLNVTRIFTALFQLGDIIYGMVPQAAIPAGAGSINTGCGRGAGGGFVSDPTTLAHEFGHLYGRPHVAVPGDPNDDTSYPNYGGSSTSIGEVGIDTGTSPPTLFDPGSSNDIMSYAGNQWTSPYTYQKILDARATHQTAPIDPKRLRPLLVIDFRLHRFRPDALRVEVNKVARIKAPGAVPTTASNAVSPVSIDLLDSHRRILATHHCMFVPAQGGGRCGCGRGGGGSVPLDREPWLDFTEVIEWPDDNVAAIAFHDGREPFHTIEVGEAPHVEIAGPERAEHTLTVRVRATHPRSRVSVVVLFSPDEGVTWQPVAFDPPEGIVRVTTSRLQGGERCLFRAVGTAELRSSTADTGPFELPRTGRRLYVGAPSGECDTPVGPVTLSARVDSRGLGAVSPLEIHWSSNLDGELGYGYAVTPPLSEGRHEVTVTAPDGIGGTLSERAIIIVGGRPR